jgi:hypothetical protein
MSVPQNRLRRVLFKEYINLFNYLFVGKTEEKRQTGSTRGRWADNIKMDLREIRWDGMDWIDVAQDKDQWRALVNTVMNLRIPQNAGKFLSSCRIGGFTRGAQLH